MPPVSPITAALKTVFCSRPWKPAAVTLDSNLMMMAMLVMVGLYLRAHNS